MMAPLDQESPSWPGGYEMDMKKQYEEAFRAGQCTVAVLATTEDRKRLATDILRQHGGAISSTSSGTSRSSGWPDRRW